MLNTNVQILLYILYIIYIIIYYIYYYLYYIYYLLYILSVFNLQFRWKLWSVINSFLCISITPTQQTIYTLKGIKYSSTVQMSMTRVIFNFPTEKKEKTVVEPAKLQTVIYFNKCQIWMLWRIFSSSRLNFGIWYFIKPFFVAN